MILSVVGSGSGVLYGQDLGSESVYSLNQDGYQGIVDPNSETDTLGRKDGKQVKVRKPLESYYFSDSLKQNNVFAWKFKHKYNDIEVIEIDTALYNFQKDYIFLRDEKVGAAYLGNLGGGAISLDYEQRATANTPFSIINPFLAYIFTPENVPHYNGKRPFTQLTYFMSGQTTKLEQQLRITHAQNISPSSGVNISYRNNGTKGSYDHQYAMQRNLSLAFAHTGKRYSLHAGYIHNMADMYENGGVVNDSEVTDTVIDLPENIQMQLGDARTRFKGNTFYYTQSYAIPFSALDSTEFSSLANKTSFFVGQGFKYSTLNKVYSDTKDESGDFYDNWYISPSATSDSIAENRLDINGFIQFQPYSRTGVLGLMTGGVGYLAEKYYYFSPEEYISPYKATAKSSLYVYGALSGSLSRYLKWGSDINFTPIGYRIGDLELKADIALSAYIKEKPMNVKFDLLIRNETPSYWSENFYSNHYQWSNSFNKETETRIGAEITIPDYGIELGASQSVVKNKIYYDAASLPAQESEAVSISGIYLQKDFHLGGFHLNHRAKLQWSSNQEVVPVPMLSANLLYYYEFDVVKGVLRMQVGVDGYYNTKYYGYGYNPAISQFYNQREVETGEYPMLDGYISGKWKRVRLLVKFQHLNYEMFGGRNYFDIAHYPLNRRMIRFGLSWNFYD